MQRSDSALLRSAPGTSGFRCWEYGGRAPGNWGRRLSPRGYTRSRFFRAALVARCAEKLRKEFPPLPSSTADPFAKSSRLLRSPPSRPHSETPPSASLQAMASCASQETGTPVVSDEFQSEETPVRSQEISFPLVSPDGKNMEYAADTIFTEVKRMKDVLLDMRAATSRQKSLSTAVRNGMISMESSLDLIDTFWQEWKISMERLQRESREKETQAPSPSMVAAASTTAGKRTAGSPPEHPREEKRQRDVGEPASVDATEESEFRPVVSKKKKRKAKAVDKSGKRQDLPPPPPPQVKNPEKLPRSRPGRQVVIVKPKAGKSYAEILGAIIGRLELVPKSRALWYAT
ncbi:hypothetical protein J6590_056869 [Homalodisca vitripennis]|nr:hypothetical protein J6590_056869 [Homalodisca vitripennis]